MSSEARMTPDERVSGVSLAAIFALRMAGLFLVLPVFSLHARTLAGGEDLRLAGFAFGVFGLTQAFLQIPFGMASDRFGRKKVITVGLLIFALGSVVAAFAPDIYWMIVGRVLQGAGAISAAVTALAADLTREQHRTKVMAMIGSSIGLVFALSLVVSPLLYGWIGMGGLFMLIATLSILAIILLWRVVPHEPPLARHESNYKKVSFMAVLQMPDLLRLNAGIFILHLIQMAMFFVLPHALVQSGLLAPLHWQVYLPAVFFSFALMVPAIIFAEKQGKMAPIFRAAIFLLAMVQIGLFFFSNSLWFLFGWLFLFFVAFNVLEATLPSLVSRAAPAHARGAALGVYNAAQSVGIFCGSLLGGALSQQSGNAAVFLSSAVLAVIWLALSFFMRFPVRKVV